MNPRELVILLLGLAIVAVVLRGLYVALQARRGQIRLAIDKNIPKDVDLDALEMAELPSGGARVVRRGAEDERSSAQQAATAAVSRANARAAELDLGDEAGEAVPVLMDAVQVSSEQPQAEGRRILIDDYAADYDEDHQEHESQHQDGWNDAAGRESLAEDEEAEQYEQEFEDAVGESGVVSAHRDAPESDDLLDDDPDAVLLDYETDELAAVAPDYDDAESDSSARDTSEDEIYDEDDFEEDIDEPYQQVDSFDDSEDSDDADDYDGEYDDEEGDEEGDEESYSEEDYDEEDYEEEGYEEDYEEGYDDDEEPEDRPEPALGDFEDDLDDFSMTAGERIGYEGRKSRETASQPSAKRTSPSQSALFESDDEMDSLASSAGKGGKRRSLFAALGNWRKSITRNAGDDGQEDHPEERVAQAQQAEPQAPDNDPVAESPVTGSSREAQTVYEMEPQQLDIEPEVHDSVEATASASAANADQGERSGEPSEVLVLNVMAKGGYVFAGDDLMHTLITSGLKFGDMNIFHQRLGNQPKGPVIFSLANILNPGTFDLNSMDTFTTPGVSLFLALPSPINNLDAFEKMLDLARQLCGTLGGELRDDNRNLMTAQTIEHYRQRVRDFELRQLKAAGSRG